DNPDAAESFKMLLELWGHEVRIAANGIDALRAVDEFDPVIAFVDLGLPGMSGFEVARRIRSNPRTRGIHLAALTGYGRDEDKEEARKAGFDRHFTKPVDVDAVWSLVESMTQKARPAPTRELLH